MVEVNRNTVWWILHDVNRSMLSGGRNILIIGCRWYILMVACEQRLLISGVMRCGGENSSVKALLVKVRRRFLDA